VVDEYKEVYKIPQETSREPLTLGELVNLIEKGGHRDLPGNLAVGFNEFNLVGQPHSACRHFTSICSRLYPQLYAHFEHVFDDWAREDEPDPEEDIQAEEDEEMAGPGEGRNADD
jgi:hypothetical protein